LHKRDNRILTPVYGPAGEALKRYLRSRGSRLFRMFLDHLLRTIPHVDPFTFNGEAGGIRTDPLQDVEHGTCAETAGLQRSGFQNCLDVTSRFDDSSIQGARSILSIAIKVPMGNCHVVQCGAGKGALSKGCTNGDLRFLMAQEPWRPMGVCLPGSLYTIRYIFQLEGDVCPARDRWSSGVLLYTVLTPRGLRDRSTFHVGFTLRVLQEYFLARHLQRKKDVNLQYPASVQALLGYVAAPRASAVAPAVALRDS
jgi:hypothetical protein